MEIACWRGKPVDGGDDADISSYVSEKSISENCDELVESSDVLRFKSFSRDALS